MEESNLNTIIKNSFIVKGFFADKIGDPKGGYGKQNPFDGFAVVPNTNIYWEAKLLKNKIKSFNFNIIEKHQYDNLGLIYNLNNMNLSIYPIGIYISRQLFHVFVFEHATIEYLKTLGKNSVLKKDFEILINKNLYLPVENKNLSDNEKKRLNIISDTTKLIDIDLIPERLITVNDIEDLIDWSI